MAHAFRCAYDKLLCEALVTQHAARRSTVRHSMVQAEHACRVACIDKPGLLFHMFLLACYVPATPLCMQVLRKHMRLIVRCKSFHPSSTLIGMLSEQ